VLDLLMPILREAAQKHFLEPSTLDGFGNASDILVVIPYCRARAKTDGEIVTVTGVLTVSDQFSGSAIFRTTFWSNCC
jgi:hypothetical protein